MAIFALGKPVRAFSFGPTLGVFLPLALSNQHASGIGLMFICVLFLAVPADWNLERRRPFTESSSFPHLSCFFDSILLFGAFDLPFQDGFSYFIGLQFNHKLH